MFVNEKEYIIFACSRLHCQIKLQYLSRPHDNLKKKVVLTMTMTQVCEFFVYYQEQIFFLKTFSFLILFTFMVSVLTSALFHVDFHCIPQQMSLASQTTIQDASLFENLVNSSIHVVNQVNFMFELEVHILVHRLGGYFTGLCDTSIADFQKAIAFYLFFIRLV